MTTRNMVVMKRDELKLKDALVSAGIGAGEVDEAREKPLLRRIRRRRDSKRSSAAASKRPNVCSSSSTRAEFQRLKTVLPSIAGKDGVSRLDIILEAIKYIDDLQVRRAKESTQSLPLDT